MALPSYVWPASGAAARGSAIVPFGSGVAVADWTAPKVWPYSGSHFQLPIILASAATPGLSAAVTDGASGLWTVSYAGTLYHVPPSGGFASQAMPAGPVYVGCAIAGAATYVLASSGTVLTSAGTVLGGFPTPALALVGSGSVLAALLPASGLGTMTTAGVTGLVTFPAGLTVPSCLAMAVGTPVAVGGWQSAAALAAANAAALSPTDTTAMVAVASGSAIVWRAAAGLTDAWAATQTLAGLVNNTAMAWSFDGFHVMTASPASGVVQVLSYAAGTLALTQSLSVSGACGVAFGPDSLHALIAQSGQAQALPLVFSSTWASATAVTGLAGITTLMAYNSGAVAAYTNGLAWLNLASGVWSVGSTTTLGFTPSLLAQDPFLNVYAVASGQLAVVNNTGTVVGSGVFSGLPTGLAVQPGRVILSVPAANTLYSLGTVTAGSWTQQASAALSLGASVGLAVSQTTLFAMGSASTVTYGFSGTPFVLTSVISGAVAQLSGGSWTVTPLGLGNTPSAVGYDVSGNLRVLTTENTQWSVATSGTVLSSGSVAQIVQQAQSVPLGLSALTVAPTGIYAATSIPGLLINLA